MGNVFNRYGAGGGKSEGIYIWKKYNYTPVRSIVNPTFKLAYTNTTQSTISNANFDYLTLPQIQQATGNSYITTVGTADEKTIAEFYDGFVGANGEKLLINSAYRLEFTYSDFSSCYLRGICNGIVYSASSMSYWTSINFSYTGTKTIPAKVGSLIGYVVSDDSSAYPDKQEQGGYWYEKAELGVLDCTKKVTGQFVPSSTMQGMTVTHNLGVKPKFGYVYQNNGGSYCQDMGQVFCDTKTASATRGGSATSPYAYYGNSSPTTTTCVFMNYSNTWAKFESGVTYHYVLLG